MPALTGTQDLETAVAVDRVDDPNGRVGVGDAGIPMRGRASTGRPALTDARPPGPAAPAVELRCSTCGYAIASYRVVPACPMCRSRSWERAGRARESRGGGDDRASRRGAVASLGAANG